MPRPPADQPHDHPILRTKLHRPPVTGDFVYRSRLHEHIGLGLETPLTLVSAPAGYGKSTLVSHWIESQDLPCAWLSLDDADSDLNVFVSYLIAAIRTVFDDSCAELEALIAAPRPQPVSVLGGCLVNELDAVETSFLLTLDDYQRIEATSRVHELIGFLLKQPPAPLRLVIVTRHDPPLPMASMRASGCLTDVRLKDLEFSPPDVAAFLEKTAGLRVSEEALENLRNQTEGWAAGLRLVSLHLRHADDPDGFLKGLRGGIQHVREYLVHEVLARQSPQMRDWLLRTSILERFCPQLCDALRVDDDTDEGSDVDGRLFIDRLVRSNLFTISLDAGGEWFRYHHLFQEFLNSFLQREWNSEEVSALHARASAWFVEQGMIEEAVRHALAAGDLQAAMRLVEQHRYQLLNTEQWSLLERRLRLLPNDAVAANPVLLSTRALIHYFRGQIVEAIAHRDRAEALLSTLPAESPARKEAEGEIALITAVEAYLSGDGHRTLERAERALCLLPLEALQIRSLSLGFRALARQTLGDVAGAFQSIEEALAESPSIGALHRVRLLNFCCLTHMVAGSLDQLSRPALESIEFGVEAGLRGSTGAARYFLGVSHYLRNELSEAERYLSAVLADRVLLRTAFTVHGAAALASVHLAQGSTAEASRVIQLANVHFVQSGETLAQATMRAFEVDLAVRQGRIADARRLRVSAEFEPYPPIYYFYVPQLTPARLLLAEKTPGGLKKAGEKLEKLEAFLRRTHRTTILITVLSLQALVLEAQGAEPAALDKLAEALALAEPGGIIRSFVDLGSPMAHLLTRLSRDIGNVTHVERVLAAFGDPAELAAEGAPRVAEGPSLRATEASRALDPSALDALTNRELDVLQLLAERLQNKEISDRLCISPHTVNDHLKRIYQKLSVSNRRQAVERAIEIGALTRGQRWAGR